LGKDLFIKDFDKQLIGVKKQKEKIVDVVLPDNYPHKEYSNKISYKFKFELEKLPIEIKEIQQRIEEIKNKLKDTNSNLNNFKELTNITKEMSNLENQQLQKENRWLELTEMEETANNSNE